MNHLKTLTAALLLAAAVPASACRPLAPWEAFFYFADRNEDGKISLREWLAYDKDTAISISVELDTANFRRLDSNRNGTLERKELYPKPGGESMFGYKVDPCAGDPSMGEAKSLPDRLADVVKALFGTGS